MSRGFVPSRADAIEKYARQKSIYAGDKPSWLFAHVGALKNAAALKVGGLVEFEVNSGRQNATDAMADAVRPLEASQNPEEAPKKLQRDLLHVTCVEGLGFSSRLAQDTPRAQGSLQLRGVCGEPRWCSRTAPPAHSWLAGRFARVGRAGSRAGQRRLIQGAPPRPRWRDFGAPRAPWARGGGRGAGWPIAAAWG